ncbi:Type VII secretion integral membrane protein EccD OS=Streptomyces rimosus subsp. rimosus (strain ATCC / DSM 40260 / JCM 4667 / NRRL 2234) OX=1265868 GN=eccD PE=3 SV=1 [Streptomyces rimosus subsp. rimosus]
MTVLIASVLLVVLLPRGDAPFVAAAFLASIGTLAVFASILTEAEPREVAAVTAVVAIAVVAWLPSLSSRFARLPIGYKSPDQIAKGPHDGDQDAMTESVDFIKIGNQAKRGHELLLGLVAGCSALVVGAAGVVLGFSDNVWRSCSRWPRASRSCCAPGSSTTPRRSPA